MTSLSNKCDAAFADLPLLKQQLQQSTHGADLFDVESGIEYFTANQIAAQISEAVRDFTSASTGVGYTAKLHTVEKTIKKCAKALEGCKKQLDDAVRSTGNKEELESKAVENWKDFAFGVTQLSLLVPMKRVEVLELLGSSRCTVSTVEAAPRLKTTFDLQVH